VVHAPAALLTRKSPWYPLRGLQIRPGRYGGTKSILPLQGIEARLLGRPVGSLIVIGVKDKVVPLPNQLSTMP
jgi:hypothetical protein